MAQAWRWLRSLVFVGQMYVMMLVIGLLYLPGAILSPEGARRGCKAYCRWVFWTARWMVGLRCEVRGTPPTEGALVAAKHQSFLDILIIFNALPAAIFIMKREILWTPIIGLYAYRLGCVPVNRGKRGIAIKKMLNDVATGHAPAGQLIIYSQGTRVAPGVKPPTRWGPARFMCRWNSLARPLRPMWVCSGPAPVSTANRALPWRNSCRSSRRDWSGTPSCSVWRTRLKPHPTR